MKELVTCQFEVITPIIAGSYLRANHPRNRAAHAQRQRRFANEMRAGRWMQTGETIKFDSDENLIDGAHRLRSIVASSAPQRLLVVRGLPLESIYIIDTEGMRTSSDILSMAGVVKDKRLIAAMTYLLAWYSGTPKGTITKRVRVHVWEKHEKEILDSVGIGRNKSLGLSGIVSQSAILSTLLILRREFRDEDLNAFMDRAWMGLGLIAGDPCLAWRRHFEKRSRAARCAVNNAFTPFIHHTMRLCLVDMIAGKERRLIKGKTPESFPYWGESGT